MVESLACLAFVSWLRVMSGQFSKRVYAIERVAEYIRTVLDHHGVGYHEPFPHDMAEACYDIIKRAENPPPMQGEELENVLASRAKGEG